MTALSLIAQALYTGSAAALRQDWEKWRLGSKITAIFTPNPEQVVQAQHNAAFETVLMSADVLLADGIGLVWAANKFQPNQKIQRFSGRQILEWWLHEAQQRQISTLLLGAQKGVAEALAKQFDPKGVWCWAAEGYAKVATPTLAEKKAIFSLIELAKPEVVFVAFGAPWQEMWVMENRAQLQQLGVKIVMVCGGAINTLSPVTEITKPPAWVEKLQLEWLFRLWQEPWRWRRQLRLVEFVRMVCTDKQ
jgi:N-acetylglucosaminyldiphosphoundecaprenol N-acetyl-beta-D-mannosaminyltransferase